MYKAFNQTSFEIFRLNSLEERMERIRSIIQPIFYELGETYAPYIAKETGYDMFFHVAQHRRRTANPPESTWCAIGGDARGYKKYPHLQFGINEEHIFIFLSIIDNPIHEIAMGEELLINRQNWKHLNDQFVLSGDHTKSKVEDLTEEKGVKFLERLVKVKKGEFLIGRVIAMDSLLLKDSKAQHEYIEETVNQLLPLYRQLLNIHFEQSEPMKED